MSGRLTAIGLAVVIVSLGLCAVLQRKIDAARRADLKHELLYLPNDKLLNHFTAGLSSVVADLLWLRTIEYVVEEYREDERRFTWLDQMCTTITRLDPHFVGAYVNGGMMMGAIGSDEEAIVFLREGVKNNPYSWEICFELAKMYVMNRRHLPESSAIAAHYLGMTALRSPEPEFYFDWMDRIQREEGLSRDARRLWEEMLESADSEFQRNLAQQELEELDIEEKVERLELAADRYEERHGRRPLDLGELVLGGFVEEADKLRQAWEGKYFFDAQGKVANTRLLDDLVEISLRYLRKKIRIFHTEEGRFPTRLDEMFRRPNQEVPDHPYTDRQWQYDPATGEVSN